MPRARPVATDGDAVAANRVRFLTADSVEPGRVRGSILASWRRSRHMKVEADQVALSYQPDPETDTPLTRTAYPVLLGLRERLEGAPVSIILTDKTGLVLERLTGDHELERHLDRVLLAPGFSYAEEFVGTNGIGTALEVGAPTHVFGHEHYAENLEMFGCAGVPIHDPISGRTIGALDLTCWRRDASPFLLTLAKTTADQIQQALLNESTGHQMELFREYLRTSRRMSGAVFAVDGDLVMMNDYARDVLSPVDQAALLSQATEALAAGRRGAVVAELPTGTPARMYCRAVPGGNGTSGVVHVKLGDAADRHVGSREAGPRLPLPGLAGTAPLWVRASDEVEHVFEAGEWLALGGEPGVGKLALLRAVHARRAPDEPFMVLDAADSRSAADWLASVRGALLEGSGSLVLRHVDRLDSRTVQALASALDDVRDVDGADSPWVAVTLGKTAEAPALARLLRLFPCGVEVPPLRMHPEDIPPMVSLFLNRLAGEGQLTCSPEAMTVLRRSPWPGNAEQLHGVLRDVMRHRRSGSILPEDLPPAARTVSRRLLSQLESMERDAIVQSLEDAHGNKLAAARSLGMSRATIYRKIHEFGIVVPS